MNNKPNLFLIGAAKCGTTSLASSMSRHPSIYVPDTKEPHFFDLKDDMFAIGEPSYAAHYKSSDKQRYFLDATPSYLSYPDIVIPRLVNYLGGSDVSIVAVLREPSSRAFSHYKHLTRSRGIQQEFQELIDKDKSGLIDRSPATWTNVYSDGLYGAHLSEWNKVFGDRLHVILYEDLITLHDKVFDQLSSYLHIEPLSNFAKLERENAMSSPKVASIARVMHTDNVFRAVAGKLVPTLALRKAVARTIRKVNKRTSVQRDECDEATLRHLRSLYADDVGLLKKLYPSLNIEEKWGYAND